MLLFFIYGYAARAYAAFREHIYAYIYVAPAMIGMMVLVRFVGVWFRTRPSHLPMSFSDRCLGLFADEAKFRRLEAELIANEVAHHGTQICMLRDLYRQVAPGAPACRLSIGASRAASTRARG